MGQKQIIFILLMAGSVFSQPKVAPMHYDTVMLSWDANIDVDLAGYNIYWLDTDSTWQVAWATQDTAVMVLVDTTSMVFAISAFDTAGNSESSKTPSYSSPWKMYIFGFIHNAEFSEGYLTLYADYIITIGYYGIIKSQKLTFEIYKYSGYICFV